MLWALAIVCCGIIHIASAQDDPDNGGGNARLLYNLPFIVVPVVVFILFIIGIIIGAYLIYRARYYGAFACCSLSMRYKSSGYESDGAKKEGSLNTPHPLTAPPKYHDALKDELVSSGEDSDKVPLVV